MIITKLVGGLGNQMFQYAIGRNLAAKNNVQLKLDISWYRNIAHASTKREYALSVFNITENFASNFDCFRIKLWRGSYLERVIASRLPSIYALSTTLRSNYFLEAANKKFAPSVLSIKNVAYLEGDWQSEKYFSEIKEPLRREFTLKENLDAKNKHLLQQIEKTNSVGIHTRRTDYISNKAHWHYYAHCSLGYYRRSLELISKQNKTFKIFVFSDDPDWVRQNLKFHYQNIYISQNPPSAGHKDLWLMSQCKHNIIANSSFSWWAAWLNPNPNKMVIAPKKWFQDKSTDSSNIIPEGWIKI